MQRIGRETTEKNARITQLQFCYTLVLMNAIVEAAVAAIAATVVVIVCVRVRVRVYYV